MDETYEELVDLCKGESQNRLQQVKLKVYSSVQVTLFV